MCMYTYMYVCMPMCIFVPVCVLLTRPHRRQRKFVTLLRPDSTLVLSVSPPLYNLVQILSLGLFLLMIRLKRKSWRSRNVKMYFYLLLWLFFFFPALCVRVIRFNFGRIKTTDQEMALYSCCSSLLIYLFFVLFCLSVNSYISLHLLCRIICFRLSILSSHHPFIRSIYVYINLDTYLFTYQSIRYSIYQTSVYSFVSTQ